MVKRLFIFMKHGEKKTRTLVHFLQKKKTTMNRVKIKKYTVENI